MNILLQICCAPCSVYPIDELRGEGHRIAGFFYNPNIHPYSEYLRRRNEVEKYSAEADINVVYPDYEIEDYFQYITHSEDPRNRCPICWWLRMAKTARFAHENNFDAFTTTLLGSPYQDQETIRKIGIEVASKIEKLNFYYKDFKPGFRQAHDKSRAKGMYCQKYCGCLFSETEMIKKASGKPSRKKA